MNCILHLSSTVKWMKRIFFFSLILTAKIHFQFVFHSFWLCRRSSQHTICNIAFNECTVLHCEGKKIAISVGYFFLLILILNTTANFTPSRLRHRHQDDSKLICYICKLHDLLEIKNIHKIAKIIVLPIKTAEWMRENSSR